MHTEPEQRLEAFERMLLAVQEQSRAVTQKMEPLKAAGQTKTATFRQLMGEKLTLQNILSLYQVYGLAER